MKNYYDKYIAELLTGDVRSPRNLPIHSKQNATFRIPIGYTYRRMKDNPLIGFMEGMQFIAGVFKHDQIARVAPNAKLELFTNQSAYGPRVGRQMHKIVKELLANKHSRRAVMILGRPEEALADRPCTTSLQFRITGKYMNTIATMRSSDAVGGLPYDLIQFGLMSQVIASCIDKRAGNLTINIADAYIYESIQHLAKNFEVWKFSMPFTDISLYHPAMVDTYQAYAKSVIRYLSSAWLKDSFHFEKADKQW